MKIETEVHELTEQQKRHAHKVLSEMLHAINTIEESYTLFCVDEDNRNLTRRLINEFNQEEGPTDGTVDEALAFFHVFKMKVETEKERLNTSINKYN